MLTNFIARVVSVDDPEEAGRLQIRVMGIHDDESRIPDDMLPWARCIFPITNPIHAGVAGPITGVVVGTIVAGYFADPNNKQIPLVTGTLGANSEEKRDYPRSNSGDDHNEVLGENIFHVGTAEIKYLKNKTIGTIEYAGQNIEGLISAVENGNLVGAISKIRDIKRQSDFLKQLITDSPIEQLNSIVAGYASDITNIAQTEIDAILSGPEGQLFQDTLTRINQASATLLGTANFAVGNIADILNTDGLNSVKDALGRVKGLKSQMSGPMGKVDSVFSDIKSNVAKKADLVGNAKSKINEVSSRVESVSNVTTQGII